MGGVVIPRIEKFKYLRSIIEEWGDIDEDINHRIRIGAKNRRRPMEYHVTKRFLSDWKEEFIEW